jgi:hypothetical protein
LPDRRGSLVTALIATLLVSITLFQPAAAQSPELQ